MIRKYFDLLIVSWLEKVPVPYFPPNSDESQDKGLKGFISIT